jgi:N-methylhydantoinase A
MVGLDMGGTSTDVALVEVHGRGRPSAPTIAGLPLAIPAVDVHTIGCGGGSIAYVDAGGALRVGPQSAGAEPGPACYGLGDEPTVTDAHVALGHLGAHTLLGGGFPIDPGRAVAALRRLARRLGTSPLACARGVVEVAESAMARALLVMTVARAVDPADVPLLAFGGAGGLHAAGLVQRLGMPRALVPPHPGAFSAVGLALAGESRELQAPALRRLDPKGVREVRARLRELEREARAALAAGSRTRGQAAVRTEVLVRYAGQGGGLWVPGPSDWGRELARTHAARYGFVPADRAVEAVEVRARAEQEGPSWPRDRSVASRKAPKPRGRRRAPLGHAVWDVYAREDLAPGQRLAGPCIVEELTAATRVPAGVVVGVIPEGLELRAGGGAAG